MSDKKIILKAAKDAPEFISMGNLEATQKDGFFETGNRAFADAIIERGYAAEVEKQTKKAEESAKGDK